jgi:hypothetical protein
MTSENSNEPPPPLSYKASLELVRPELAAIPSERVLRGVTLDASVAAKVAEAGAAKLMPHREALIAEFGERVRVLLDGLVVIAHATKQTDIELARTKTSDDLSPMQAEVTKHYELLMAAARALATHGFIHRPALEPAESILGYDALINSLLILVSLFRELWPNLEHRTLIKLTDLDAAELAAHRMTSAIAYRDFGVHRVAAADLRDRAMTKLLKDYDAIRRVVSYLRWEEKDADVLVPSFWAAARGRKRRTKAEHVASEDLESSLEPRSVIRNEVNGGTEVVERQGRRNLG